MLSVSAAERYQVVVQSLLKVAEWLMPSMSTVYVFSAPTAAGRT